MQFIFKSILPDIITIIIVQISLPGAFSERLAYRINFLQPNETESFII